MQVPGETLFPIEEAINRGTIIMNLLSDAAQSQTWPQLAPLITKGKTLYFSHGFSVVYKEDTGVVAPSDVDVILVAPKGSGRTVRTLFKEGRGINSSIAVWQDVTGKAKEKAVALGVAVGSGYMYETTFEKEVYSDLYGERGVVRINFAAHIPGYVANALIVVDGCHSGPFPCAIQGSSCQRSHSFGSFQ
jgi:ketol-acid reductoisomerase